jgi:lipoic acid synthetase
LPSWFKIKLPDPKLMADTKACIDRWQLNTVCKEAKCPNAGECFSKGTATALIMGDTCTRGCPFCAVATGKPQPLDPTEPERVAKAVQEMGLSYVVITSVTRDDLPDGGAAHFAATIAAVKKYSPQTKVEVLIPDFQGDPKALETVVEAGPDVISHNLETVPSLYSKVRAGADYQRSLGVVERIKELARDIYSKTGFMLGLGESREEVMAVLKDLVRIKCDIVTIGQYLSPSDNHLSVVEFIEPHVFTEYARLGEGMGIPRVVAGPLVRSSYLAEEALPEASTGVSS